MPSLPTRLSALERIFGPHAATIASPIPFAFGGDPDIVRFDNSKQIKGEVYCTNNFAADDSTGQRTTPHPTSEFVVVLRPGSRIAPTPTSPGSQFIHKGFVGVMLSAASRISCRHTLGHGLAPGLGHGHTMGPLDEPRLAPMDHLLFLELTSDKFPFVVEGVRCGLLLCTLITGAELRYKHARGTDALIKLLKKAGAYPYTDPDRASAV